MNKIPNILRLLRAYEDNSKEYKHFFVSNKLGVSVGQVGVLRTLKREGCMTTSNLAETVSIHIATAEGYTKRLSQKGLIKVTVDPADRRRRLLEITAAGEKVIEGIPLAYKSMLVHNLKTISTDEEIAAIEQGLTLLMKYMTYTAKDET